MSRNTLNDYHHLVMKNPDVAVVDNIVYYGLYVSYDQGDHLVLIRLMLLHHLLVLQHL